MIMIDASKIACVNDVHLVNSVALHNAQLNRLPVKIIYILHDTNCAYVIVVLLKIMAVD